MPKDRPPKKIKAVCSACGGKGRIKAILGRDLGKCTVCKGRGWVRL